MNPTGQIMIRVTNPLGRSGISNRVRIAYLQKEKKKRIIIIKKKRKIKRKKSLGFCLLEEKEIKNRRKLVKIVYMKK